MLAYVILRTPDGREHRLVHGDLVGRIWSAALQLNDARVSEAHAMVSLREGMLHLIGLRGGFAVEGRPVGQVALEPDLRVEIARGLELEVVDVALPHTVLGVEGAGLVRQAIPGVCSILLDPAPRLAQGYREDAAVHLWDTGDGWMQRAPGEDVRPLRPGDALRVGGHTLHAVAIPLRAAGPAHTRRRGEASAPLRLVARFDTVHLHRDGEVVVTFSGKQARLISELVTVNAPLSWQGLSELLWPDEPDPHLRRSRLDVVISRVRRKLRACGARSDLVRADGAGMVELLLYPHDSCEDLT